MGKYSFQAIIFDLDGVITKTATVHAKAWKKTFDDYLKLREKRDGEPFREFTHENDYLPYVDGKPRYQGVKSFLESRGVNIPFGEPSDPPDKETVCGVGNKKNEMFRLVLEEQGAEVFPSSIEFIKSLQAAGIRVGVASSSKNCQFILQASGIEGLFETRVDGVVSAELKLNGKPEGDIFVTAARNLGVLPAQSVVVEDATSGVQAGRNGGFGFVLGIARENNEKDLMEYGADIVVNDLAAIDIEKVEEWFHRKPIALFDYWDKKPQAPKQEKLFLNCCYSHTGKEALFNGKKLVLFLDYDGTLTPIVDRPELAVLDKSMREVIKKLIQKCTVSVVSGRMREDVENLVKIDGIFYAGSHGFDIKGPGLTMVQPQVKAIIPTVSKIIVQLKEKLGSIPGLLIEEKKFSTAVHYRLVDENKYLEQIEDVVNEIVDAEKSLRLMSGKKVFEVLPNIDWDKGKAVRWILEAMKLSWNDTAVVYIGDDVTDENAFRGVKTRGNGILVTNPIRESAADFFVTSPDEVKKLFEMIINTK